MHKKGKQQQKNLRFYDLLFITGMDSWEAECLKLLMWLKFHIMLQTKYSYILTQEVATSNLLLKESILGNEK